MENLNNFGLRDDGINIDTINSTYSAAVIKLTVIYNSSPMRGKNIAGGPILVFLECF